MNLIFLENFQLFWILCELIVTKILLLKTSATPSNLYCRRLYQLFLTKTEVSTKFLKMKDVTGYCRKSILFLRIVPMFVSVVIMSFEIPYHNREILLKDGPNSLLSRINSPLPSKRKDKNCYRKLLSSKRQLFFNCLIWRLDLSGFYLINFMILLRNSEKSRLCLLTLILEQILTFWTLK